MDAFGSAAAHKQSSSARIRDQPSGSCDALNFRDVSHDVWVEKIQVSNVKRDLADRRFCIGLAVHNRGDRVCAGVPTVSEKLLCAGEESQCQNDRAWTGLATIEDPFRHSLEEIEK